MENQTATQTSAVPIINGKLSFKEKFSYGLGDFSSNLMWGVISSFLLYYYTDVALIPVAATGTIFLVSRVLDALIDPVIGGFIDRTNSKWGRTKPYIIFGIVPLSVFYVLSFTTFDFSDSGKIMYAYFTYIIAGLLYSVVNIPYGALMPLMTRDTNEKGQLSSFRMGGMAIGNVLVTACTMPLVNFFGNGNQQQGFLWTTIVFSILSIISFSIIVKNCKERFVESTVVTKEKTSVMKTYKNAFKNGPWVATVGFSLVMFIKIGAIIAITIYYCLQVLKNPAMISILLPLLYVTMIVSSFITAPFLKKFGHRNGNMIALVIYIVCFAILPLTAHNQVLFIAIYCFANVFNGISPGSVFGMTADSVDYNEWKFGVRSEGTLYAGYSFATKVGNAIGGAVIGYVLAFTGYNAQHVTEAAVSSINFLYFGIPIICSVLQIVALLFYKLDKIHPQIVSELNERRS
jgi:glycoside/pentoside/hexuronide:cation symporter, GPH family